MICSYTELKNLIYNSGKGSNIDVGICEEISEAVANNVAKAIASNIALSDNHINFCTILDSFMCFNFT